MKKRVLKKPGKIASDYTKKPAILLFPEKVSVAKLPDTREQNHVSEFKNHILPLKFFRKP